MDHKKPQPPSTSEVESRVLASILGEASEFEQAQLDSLLAENHEAKQFADSAERTHQWMLSASLCQSLESLYASDPSSPDAERAIESMRWITKELHQLRSKREDSLDLRLSDERRSEILRLAQVVAEESERTNIGVSDAAASKASHGYWRVHFGRILSDKLNELRGWLGNRSPRQLVAIGTGCTGLLLVFLLFGVSSPEMMLSERVDRSPASGRWYQWGVDSIADSRGVQSAAPSDAAPIDELMEFDFESAEMEESATFSVADAPVGATIEPEPAVASNSQPPTSRLSLVAPTEPTTEFADGLKKLESASAVPDPSNTLLGMQMDMGGQSQGMGMTLGDSQQQAAEQSLPLPPAGGDAGFGEPTAEVQRLAERSKALEFPSLTPTPDRSAFEASVTDADSNAYFFRDYSDNGIASNMPQTQTRRSGRAIEGESRVSELDEAEGKSLDLYAGTQISLGEKDQLGDSVAGDATNRTAADRFGATEGRMLGESRSGIEDSDSDGVALGFGGGLGGGGFGGGMGGMGPSGAAAASPRYAVPSQDLEDQIGGEAKLGLLEKSIDQSRETRRGLSDEQSRQRVAGRAGVTYGKLPGAPKKNQNLNPTSESDQTSRLQQQAQVNVNSDGLVESENQANLSDPFSNAEKQNPQSGRGPVDAFGIALDDKETDKVTETIDLSGRRGEIAKAKKDRSITEERLKGKSSEVERESLFEQAGEANEIARGLVASDLSNDAKERDAQLAAPADAATWQFRQQRIEEVFKEVNAKETPFSTFSLHVSDVSFKLARDAFSKGQWPDASRVRIEEFVNALDYGDPMPTQRERIACQIEQAIHPALQQRNLVRVSMRTAATGRSTSTPLRLTFLLDHSGSMERSDRRRTVQRVFQVLAGQLQQQDQVTLISFASQPRLLADRLPGLQAADALRLIEQLPSEGGTNLEEALRLAGEKAREQFTDGAQNRVILVTDGAVNLGDANPDSLTQMILSMRDSGIAFDAAGIAADGLNDEILESLTRQGDGRYYLLDSQDSVEDGFAKQIAGALRPAAKNVKVQVEFNSQRVGMYKLLGFEKHRLKTEDFRNDAVDAAEMAAAEAGVAVYQVQVKPDGVGDIGTVAIRFQDLGSGRMVEERWPITYDASAPRLERSTVSMKLAGVASLFAMKLKGDERASTIDLGYLREVVNTLPQAKFESPQVGSLRQMLDQAWQMGEVPVVP